MVDERGDQAKSYTLRLVILWALVTIPLGWGLWQTILKTTQLFK